MSVLPRIGPQSDDDDGWLCVRSEQGATVCVDGFDDGSANLHFYWPGGSDGVAGLSAEAAKAIGRALIGEGD